MNVKPLRVSFLPVFLAGLCLQSGVQVREKQMRAKQPNIILIMADDMGYSDLGAYGSEINTPNVDKLASQGVRFTQFYNMGRCCPTRASLLSGLYPHQAGIGHMVDAYAAPARNKLNSLAYQDHLSDRCVTIAEALQAGGYQTFTSGKWHLGESTPPHQRGFEQSYALINGVSNYFDPTYDAGTGLDKSIIALNGEVQHTFDKDYFTTDAFTDYALDFVKNASKDKPYFLYLAYNAPHWPLHAKPEDIQKYRGNYLKGWDAIRVARHQRMKAMGMVKEAWPLTPRDQRVPAWQDVSSQEAWPGTVMNHGPNDNPPKWEAITSQDQWDLKMAVYAAQIDNMDQNIGRLMNYLKASGTESNTLVIFLSDNGGANERPDRGDPDAVIGTRQSYTGYHTPWANVSNTPFRQYKTSQHEGGISTPLIMRWPAVTSAAGSFDYAPGHIIDIMATCLAAAGIPYPEKYNGKVILPKEGKSLLPALQGKPRKLHEIIGWEHQGNRALRQGDWKLVSLYEGKWELYNVSTDRGEMNDVSAKYPKKVQRMATLWQAWADRVGAKPWALTK